MDNFPKLHQLGGAGVGVRFQPAALGPLVSIVVAAHVAEDGVLSGPVQDDAQVQVHASRPEVRVSRTGQPVQAEARVRQIGLQVEGGSFGRLLLLVREPGQAGSERIGYAELHTSFFGLPSDSSNKSNITWKCWKCSAVPFSQSQSQRLVLCLSFTVHFSGMSFSSPS